MAKPCENIHSTVLLIMPAVQPGLRVNSGKKESPAASWQAPEVLGGQLERWSVGVHCAPRQQAKEEFVKGEQIRLSLEPKDAPSWYANMLPAPAATDRPESRSARWAFRRVAWKEIAKDNSPMEVSLLSIELRVKSQRYDLQ